VEVTVEDGPGYVAHCNMPDAGAHRTGGEFWHWTGVQFFCPGSRPGAGRSGIGPRAMLWYTARHRTWQWTPGWLRPCKIA